MARTNVATHAPTIYTHEGAVASRIDAVAQLRRSVMACMLWEDTFYEDGKAIAERIHDEVAAVLKLKNGADIVANIAVEARNQFKLRHAPLWLAVALIRANTPETRAVVSGVLHAVIQRADEPGELVAMLWKAEGVKRKMLPAQVKIGLGSAIAKFDRYKVSKYANREAAVKLRDVMFLCHPMPKDSEQVELWKELAENKLTAPDTWEAQLSAGGDKKETFTAMLQQKTLLPMALLRNLRNMQQAKVDDGLIRDAILEMDISRVLPFRFISAAKHAPQLEPQLEVAMFKALGQFQKWPGKTALVLDHSDSMNAFISGKSEMKRADTAAALAILMREVCEEVAVYAYSMGVQSCHLLRPRRGFALRDEYMGGCEWGGTDTGQAIARANLDGYNRVIVITDEQSHTSIPKPLVGSMAYFINVAAYQNGIGYGAWNHIDGWSEACVQFIAQHEGMEMNTEKDEPEED
jgi:60 kDa SS-A/Ro ribonucleoprotein